MGDEKSSSSIVMASRDREPRDRELLIPVADSGDEDVLFKPSSSSSSSHHTGREWLTKRNKRALYEALENIVLGFLSLLLTVGQDHISDMCTSKAVEATWHPCNNKQDVKSDKAKDKSGASDDNCCRRLLSALDSSGGWPM